MYEENNKKKNEEQKSKLSAIFIQLRMKPRAGVAKRTV